MVCAEGETAVRDDHDISKLAPARIAIWIENLRRGGNTGVPLFQKLLERQAELTGKGLNVERSIAHLSAAARNGKFTTYGEVATASEVPWNLARYAMNGAGGHLDQLLDICHVRGLPMLTSICVNQANVTSGDLGPESLAGFIAGVRRLGFKVLDSEAKGFLEAKQLECFEWGRTGKA